MQTQTVLGIDYGTKRIGLAVSRGSLAEPLAVIENNKDSSQVLKKIRQVCEQEVVGRIVVGLSEGQMAEQTRNFTEKLKQALSLPIEFEDETLSSHEVMRRLKSKGIKASKRQGTIDQYAAALILQDWLDES